FFPSYSNTPSDSASDSNSDSASDSHSDSGSNVNSYSNCYTYTYSKAARQAEADSHSKSDSDSEAEANSSATRLAVPGVAISFGVQLPTLAAECSLKLFGLASIRALPNRALLPDLSTRLQVVAFQPLQGSPRTSYPASFRVRSNRRRGRVAAE